MKNGRISSFIDQRVKYAGEGGEVRTAKSSTKTERARSRLALLIYHGLSRNYCLPEQEFLARHDVPRRVPWNGGGGEERKRSPILMQSKSFNDVEARR